MIKHKEKHLICKVLSKAKINKQKISLTFYYTIKLTLKRKISSFYLFALKSCYMKIKSFPILKFSKSSLVFGKHLLDQKKIKLIALQDKIQLLELIINIKHIHFF